MSATRCLGGASRRGLRDTPDNDYFLQHTEPGAGAVSAVDCSGDSKTDKLIQNSNFSDSPRTCMHFCLKLRNQSSLGHILRTFGMCFTTLYALVWTVHDELVHVQYCITSFFQSAWFGFFFAATLERAKPRQDCAAQKMTAAVLA